MGLPGAIWMAFTRLSPARVSLVSLNVNRRSNLTPDRRPILALDSNLMQSLIRVALPLSAEESHGEAALRRLVRPQSWGRRRRVGCEDRGRVRNATLDATP